METLKKLSRAIEIIKSKNLKKKGKNTFSKYEYYTPEQVAELVMGACHEVKIYPKFDLIRDPLGITGVLSIYNTESDEAPIIFNMASDIPSIKATNISQQLGGAMTYTKRYLLMNAFDIVENELELDNEKFNEIPEHMELAISVANKEQLASIFNNNKGLQGNAEFMRLMNKRKTEIK